MKPQFESSAVQLLSDLADLTELLSISLMPPTRELAAALCDGSFCSDLAACLGGLSCALEGNAASAGAIRISETAKAFAADDEDTLYHSINREYTRLFLSPRCEQMPLYESLIVHRDDSKASMFINPTCMHCEQEYRKHGFSFPEKGKIPGDHAAIELRYTAYLLSQRIAAMCTHNKEADSRAKALLEEFSHAHLVRWYVPFMQELSSCAAHPFYALVSVTALASAPLLLTSC